MGRKTFRGEMQIANGKCEFMYMIRKPKKKRRIFSVVAPGAEYRAVLTVCVECKYEKSIDNRTYRCGRSVPD